MRVAAGREPLDVAHRLAIGAAAVVPSDNEQDGRADAVGEVDQVAVAHELGHVLRLLAAGSARS